MSDWLKPYLVSRARLQALRALVLAGGEVQGWQLHRALEPVLGDLLPLPTAALEDEESREAARRRSVAWALEADRREVLGRLLGAGGPEETVDSKAEELPW